MGLLPQPSDRGVVAPGSQRPALHSYTALVAKGLYGGACGDRRFGG